MSTPPNLDLSGALARIERLEQFKTELEKKIFAAVAVATVLGIVSLGGGVWISSLVKNIDELTTKSSVIDTKLQAVEAKAFRVDTELVAAISKLNNARDQAAQEIAVGVGKVRDQLATTSERSIRAYEADLRKIAERTRTSAGTQDELATRLANGSLNAVFNSVAVRNARGNITASIGSDEEGDGFLRINAKDGDRRYLLNLYSGHAQSQFYNRQSKRVMSMGLYSDDTIGFIRLRDSMDTLTLLELKADAKGGSLISNALPSGKNIVFLGPENNSGNGLVNVMGLKGEATNSHSPR